MPVSMAEGGHFMTAWGPVSLCHVLLTADRSDLCLVACVSVGPAWQARLHCECALLPGLGAVDTLAQQREGPT